jgi:predicted permease
MLVSILSALSLLMLVVAAANVSGLLLAGAAAAQRQVAIHLALGATRAAIVRRHLLEGALIGLGGGAATAAIYAWIRPIFAEITLLPTLPLRLDLPWTPALVGGLVLGSVLCGGLLALAPAWWTLRTVRASGAPGDTRLAGNPGLSRVRRILVSAQVCLSFVLVVGAVLFSRSVDERAAADLGFPRDRLAAFDFDVEPAVPDPTRLPVLAREALARTAAVPGVRAVAMASRAPVDASTPGTDVFPAGGEARLLHDASFTQVTTGYFDVLELPIVRGRMFVDTDTASAAIAVINETMAERLWPGEDALGRPFVLRADGRALRVIGIAKDSKYRSIAEPSQPHFYLPAQPNFRLTLLAATVVDPRRVLTPVQAALSSVGPGIVGFFPRTFEDHVAIDVLPARAAAAAARSLGLLAVVLSAAGLHGVIAWLVEVRRREIGVRMALGASSAAMARHVAGHALRTAAPGLAAGIVLAVIGGHAARSFLFGVRPHDPMAFAAAALAFATIVAVAAWLPARRASRTDPAIVLRGD